MHSQTDVIQVIIIWRPGQIQIEISEKSDPFAASEIIIWQNSLYFFIKSPACVVRRLGLWSWILSKCNRKATKLQNDLKYAIGRSTLQLTCTVNLSESQHFKHIFWNGKIDIYIYIYIYRKVIYSTLFLDSVFTSQKRILFCFQKFNWSWCFHSVWNQVLVLKKYLVFLAYCVCVSIWPSVG